MDEVILRCFLSSSNRSLFEETKAISIPEKKAEKKRVIKTAVKLFTLKN